MFFIKNLVDRLKVAGSESSTKGRTKVGKKVDQTMGVVRNSGRRGPRGSKKEKEMIIEPTV